MYVKKTGVQPIGQTEKAVLPFCVMGSVRKSIFFPLYVTSTAQKLCLQSWAQP